MIILTVKERKMLVQDFREVILEKSNGRTTLPADAKLYQRIHTALKKIAKDTVPLKLVEQVDVDGGEQLLFSVLRRIDNKTFIRKPLRPTSEGENVDIDEELLDATALYVMAGLERGNAKAYMGMYWGEIDANNDRLIETNLSVADNEDVARYNQLP